MLNFLKKFDRILIMVLIGILLLIIVLSIIELAWTLGSDIVSSYESPLNFGVIDNLLEIFALFLLILIGIELLETMKIYLRDDVVHVEFILLVAVIAIARKAVVLDLKKVDSLTIISLGILVIALSAGYFIIKKVQNK